MGFYEYSTNEVMIASKFIIVIIKKKERKRNCMHMRVCVCIYIDMCIGMNVKYNFNKFLYPLIIPLYSHHNHYTNCMLYLYKNNIVLFFWFSSISYVCCAFRLCASTEIYPYWLLEYTVGVLVCNIGGRVHLWNR